MSVVQTFSERVSGRCLSKQGHARLHCALPLFLVGYKHFFCRLSCWWTRAPFLVMIGIHGSALTINSWETHASCHLGPGSPTPLALIILLGPINTLIKNTILEQSSLTWRHVSSLCLMHITLQICILSLSISLCHGILRRCFAFSGVYIYLQICTAGGAHKEWSCS